MKRFVLVCSLLLSSVAWGQETVAELLAQEGKKLSPDETKALVTDATMKFKASMMNTQVEIAMKLLPNGSMSGMVKTPRGDMKMDGSWEMGSAGTFCTTRNIMGNTIKGCSNLYQTKAGKHFSAAAGADGASAGDAKLEAREFSR